MSFSSRLWRVLRGVSSDFDGVDPDDLLKKLRAARQEIQDGAAGSRSGSRGHGGGARSTSRAGGKQALPADVARAYSRLEMAQNSSTDDAKKAWRKLMRKYHPDRHQRDDRKREVATKLAAALTESYEIIKEYRDKRGLG
jgi:DnaJ-domain-containing protein 1